MGKLTFLLRSALPSWWIARLGSFPALPGSLPAPSYGIYGFWKRVRWQSVRFMAVGVPAWFLTTSLKVGYGGGSVGFRCFAKLIGVKKTMFFSWTVVPNFSFGSYFVRQYMLLGFRMLGKRNRLSLSASGKKFGRTYQGKSAPEKT